MTLRDQIADDVETVFLQTGDYAVTARHYPDGDVGGPGHDVTGQLLIDEAEGKGGHALDGDGIPWNERGVSERQSGIFECPAAEEITEAKGMDDGAVPSSTFLIDGEYWRTVRIVGRDSAMQAVLIVKLDQHVTRRAKRQ